MVSSNSKICASFKRTGSSGPLQDFFELKLTKSTVLVVCLLPFIPPNTKKSKNEKYQGLVYTLLSKSKRMDPSLMTVVDFHNKAGEI